MIFNSEDYTSKFIIGSDEVGYGCLAGPIMVGAVRAPRDWNLEGLNDSKKLSEKKRDIMFAKLKELSLKGEIDYWVSERQAVCIDNIGLAPAQKECYLESIKNVWDDDCTVILDGLLKLPGDQIDLSKVTSLVKADTYVPTVMAASILAKVCRDKYMRAQHAYYPQYHFDSNVGYGSPKHMAALQEHGPCVLHRHSYKPIKALVK